MYHWYLLARGVRPDGPARGGRRVGFTAGGGPGPASSLSHAELRRFLALGAIEAAPLWASPIVGALVPVHAPPGTWWLAGAAGCVALCWLLRHRVPQTPIHAAGASPGSGRAGRHRGKRDARP